jgi:hypothetical protein
MLTLSIHQSSAKMRAAGQPADSNRCSVEIDGTEAAATVQANKRKYCTRCLETRQARDRVHTDLLDMVVCPGCAEEARKLGISVQRLGRL